MGLINPALPTLGQPNSTEDVDVLNALTALVNLVNGSLDAENLAAGAVGAAELATAAKQELLGSWKTIAQSSVLAVEGDNWPSSDPRVEMHNSAGVGQLGSYSAPGPLIPLRAADYATPGLTTKLRVSLGLVDGLNAHAITFSARLYSVVSNSANSGVFVGVNETAVGNIASIANPAGGAELMATSTEFDMPADGLHVLAFYTSGAVATTRAALLTAALQLRHV